MVFEKIDKNSWNRKEYFDHYFASVPCTYSMTVKVDITQIKEKGMNDIVNIGLHFFLKDVRPMLPPVMNHSIAVA